MPPTGLMRCAPLIEVPGTPRPPDGAPPVMPCGEPPRRPLLGTAGPRPPDVGWNECGPEPFGPDEREIGDVEGEIDGPLGVTV